MEETDGARGQGTRFELLRVATGDDDHWNILCLIHSVQPIHNQKSIPGDASAVSDIRRKRDIQQDQVGTFPSRGADSDRSIIGCKHVVTACFELHRERLENDSAVIHDQYLFAVHSHLRAGHNRRKRQERDRDGIPRRSLRHDIHYIIIDPLSYFIAGLGPAGNALLRSQKFILVPY